MKRYINIKNDTVNKSFYTYIYNLMGSQIIMNLKCIEMETFTNYVFTNRHYSSDTYGKGHNTDGLRKTKIQ